MTGSRATITWVVSGALGVATFTAGMIVSQGGDTVPVESRPAVRVTPGGVPGTPTATASPTGKDSPTATATVSPSATATASTGPSPVSPPSAETPD